MAEVTEMMQLPAPPRRNGRVDWGEVLDGRVWKLICGVDFENEDGKAVRAAARREGRIRGVKVDTRPPVKEGRHVVVYVQAGRAGSDALGARAGEPNPSTL